MPSAPFLPFFIFGHPRSGTTALARLLNTSPEVACLFYEGNLTYQLWQMLQRRNVLQEPTAHLLADFKATARHNLLTRAASVNCHKIQFSEESIDLLTDIFKANLLQPSLGTQKIYHTVSRAFYTVYSQASGRPVIGDKVPDFITIPEEITAPHPESLIIHLSRDPRAIIHSTLRFNNRTHHLFTSPTAFSMAVSYAVKQKGLDRFIENFPPGRIFTVQHEKLFHDPNGIRGKILDFLNIQPRRTDNSRASLQFPEKVRLKNWSQEMTREDKETIEAVCWTFGLLGEGSKSSSCHWHLKAEVIKQIDSAPVSEIHTLLLEAEKPFRETDHLHELAFSLVTLADYRHQQGDFQGAKQFYQHAGRLLPTYLIMWYKHGRLCFDMKFLEESLDLLNFFEKNCPSTSYYTFLRAKSFLLRARANLLQGRNDRAEELLQKTLRVKPDYMLARNIAETMEGRNADHLDSTG